MTTIQASAVANHAPGAAQPAAAALQATLETLQHRLSDCVNCASASTSEGKADIASLQAQIGLVQQSINAPAKSSTPLIAAPDQVSSIQTAQDLLVGSQVNLFA
ncbi:MAG: hypothetical protein ACJ8GW_01590 [Massilia sp.]